MAKNRTNQRIDVNRMGKNCVNRTNVEERAKADNYERNTMNLKER